MVRGYIDMLTIRKILKRPSKSNETNTLITDSSKLIFLFRKFDSDTACMVYVVLLFYITLNFKF
jgi:hypothetical protein